MAGPISVCSSKVAGNGRLLETVLVIHSSICALVTTMSN